MDEIPVLDLFCGMGGLALGFALNGFRVTGYDIHPRVPEIFRINRIGLAVTADLTDPASIRPEHRDARVVTGGPPCRPWSALNLQRRGSRHPDHPLLRAFFRAVQEIAPEAFLMENVPGLVSDPIFRETVRHLASEYEMRLEIVCYADFGAATARRRLILVGFRGNRDLVILGERRADLFFRRLWDFRRPARTALEAVEPYLTTPRGEFPDHEWPNLRSVKNYEEKYRTRKYGWYRLDPDRPAPSFGNIMKTYILHPYAGDGRGIPLRVLSIREAMAIMGFPSWFRFPEGMGMGSRYQMVADAVSPVFSEICARVMRELLGHL